MDYDTPQNTDRQDHADRNARLMISVIAALVAGAFILNRFAPQPAAPLYYPADPTPFVVETQHIDVFSHNCIGWNVHC